MIGMITISLSTPMLYELFAIQRLRNLRRLVHPFPFAHPFSDRVLGWRQFILGLLHRVTPFFPMVVWMTLHFIEADLAVLTIFLCIEIIVNAIKLAFVKLRVQTCYFNVLGPIAAFDQSRSVADGRVAQNEVERAIRMVPVTGMALSVHPMLVIACVWTWLASLGIAGPPATMSRTVAAFLAMTADLMMSGADVVGLFLSPTD
jgi:hypothetical protein